MKHTEANKLKSLRAAYAFIADRAEQLPGVASSGARRRLGELLSTIDDHAAAQAASDLAAQIATRKRHALHTALLRDHMAPIVSIAAAESLASPAVSPLRMPPRWTSPEQLRAHAAGMAEFAAQSAHLFISAGLPTDFAEQLNRAAGAMHASVNEHTRHRLARARATAGLRMAIAAARRTVSALDAMVTSELRADPALLRAWKVAIRPERVPRHAAGSSVAVAPGVALVPMATSVAVQPVELPDAVFVTPRIRAAMERMLAWALSSRISSARLSGRERPLPPSTGERESTERDLLRRGWLEILWR
ncbi:MAG TPA: hypothetical protein VNE60_11870 [Gemmatimonadaceae bacterium]|nr:hypothetical protein [Gemmatimonadaceae bacterium]